METLQITLFGHIRVDHPNAPQPLRLSRSIQALLAYLLLQQQFVPRDVLMDVFWMDAAPDRARSSLTTALWRLRQALEPDGVQPGTYLITDSTGEVSFNWGSNHWLDTQLFERHLYPLVRKPLSDLNEDNMREIEATLALYRGDLLEGSYDDWALRERERFRSLHLNCLARLMAWHADRGNFERSIAIGQEILRRDPVREEIHRALMRCYLENGQRPLAVRQYAQCRDILDQELGVAPLEETQALYRQICAASRAISRDTVEQVRSVEIVQLVREMQLARQGLVEVVRTLERVNRAVSRLTESSVS